MWQIIFTFDCSSGGVEFQFDVKGVTVQIPGINGYFWVDNGEFEGNVVAFDVIFDFGTHRGFTSGQDVIGSVAVFVDFDAIWKLKIHIVYIKCSAGIRRIIFFN